MIQFAILKIDSLIKTFTLCDTIKDITFQLDSDDISFINQDDIILGFYKEPISEIRLVFKVIDKFDGGFKLSKMMEIGDGIKLTNLPDSVNRKLQMDIDCFLINEKEFTSIVSYFHLDLNSSSNKQTISVSHKRYDRFLSALRAKPFLLLSGISGTGKSRLVKELAFMTCPKYGVLDTDQTTPGNYCMIEVKPNWHDSTELLGYYSSLSGKYMLTSFIRFVYKATQYPDIPFFLCLDEMNLAPVEQYFAEYLSVLESRKKNDGIIISEELLKKDIFKCCELVTTKPAYANEEETSTANLYEGDDQDIITYLKENGLRLPNNLFVIGTVNMDDTTHQFSRKVIDRAFTIEMNGGNLEDMFDHAADLNYRDEPLPLNAIQPQYVTADEVLADNATYASIIKEEVPKRLTELNDKLKNTPFQVSYRVQNELILYLSGLMRDAENLDEHKVNDLIGEATLAVFLEKVLPRVEGDSDSFKKENSKETILTDLEEWVKSFAPVPATMPSEDGGTDDEDKETVPEKKVAKVKESVFELTLAKLDQMQKRLESTQFTSFFS